MRSSCSDFTSGGALAAVPAVDLCGRSDSGVSSLAESCVATGANDRGILEGAGASVSVVPKARAGRRVEVAVRVPDDASMPTLTCKGEHESTPHHASPGPLDCCVAFRHTPMLIVSHL